MENLSERLGSIFQLTYSMQDAAKEKDWEAVARLERDRLPLLEELFSHHYSEQDGDRIRQAVEEILGIDQGILNGAESEKNEIHAKAKQLAVEKRAFEEYAKNR